MTLNWINKERALETATRIRDELVGFSCDLLIYNSKTARLSREWLTRMFAALRDYCREMEPACRQDWAYAGWRAADRVIADLTKGRDPTDNIRDLEMALCAFFKPMES